MEGQSGDCPFTVAPIPPAARTDAAMEGQSGDCPFIGYGWSNSRSSVAAMEGQSGDCPFHRQRVDTGEA